MKSLQNIVKHNMFGILQERNYLIWWSGRATALVGDITLLLVIPTVVFQLTGSLSDWASIALVQSLTRAFFVLFGGMVVDTRRPVYSMLAAASLQVLLGAALLVISLTNGFHLWYFWIWAMLNGIALAILLPAINAFIPTLLPNDKVLAGNAFYISANQGLELLVPLIASVLIARFGLWSAFLLVTCAPAIFAFALLALPHDLAKSVQPQKQKQQAHVFGSLIEGFHAVRTDAGTTVLVLTIAIYMFGAGLMASVGLPGLAQLVYGNGATSLGILMSTLGAGAIAGSFLASMLRGKRKDGLITGILILCFGICVLATAFTPSLYGAACLILIAGACLAASSVISTTIIQVRTPVALLGRVMAIVTLALVGTEPIALAITGQVGDILGARGVMMLAGSVAIAGGLLACSSRALRSATIHKEQLAPETQSHSTEHAEAQEDTEAQSGVQTA